MGTSLAFHNIKSHFNLYLTLLYFTFLFQMQKLDNWIQNWTNKTDKKVN